jgi:hypothetical protein
MKKIIALALVLTMVFSMALSVSAKETFGDGKDSYTSNGVNIVITMTGVTVVHTYAFDIEYGTMEFTYGSEMTWDPSNYTYTASNLPATWKAVGESNVIKVVNHSDLPIYCSAEGEITDKVSGSFALSITDGAKIEACEVGDTIGSNFHKMTVNLSGTPYVAAATQMPVGKVVVVIEKEAPATNDTTTEEPTEKPSEEPTENVQ